MFAQYVRAGHPAAPRNARFTGHSAGRMAPSASIPPATTSQEQPHERQPLKACGTQKKRRSRASGYCTELGRFPHPVKAGFFLLVGVILGKPICTGSRMGMGVFAAPCTSVATTSGTGGEGVAQQLSVPPTTASDLTTVFDCEGGEFEVYWSGAVNLTGTIVIGSGTTVSIFGDGNSSEGDSSLSDQEGLEKLTSGLELPLGLTSAAVGVGPSNITSDTDTSISFGPMFYVNGGHLLLQDMIVRGGFSANTANALDGRGGGVYGVRSDVSVARCEFSDNFAEHFGGAIYANESTLTVVDSMFRSCEAGFNYTSEDGDWEGAGGGILVST